MNDEEIKNTWTQLVETSLNAISPGAVVGMILLKMVEKRRWELEANYTDDRRSPGAADGIGGSSFL